MSPVSQYGTPSGDAISPNHSQKYSSPSPLLWTLSSAQRTPTEHGIPRFKIGKHESFGIVAGCLLTRKNQVSPGTLYWAVM